MRFLFLTALLAIAPTALAQSTDKPTSKPTKQAETPQQPAEQQPKADPKEPAGKKPDAKTPDGTKPDAKTPQGTGDTKDAGDKDPEKVTDTKVQGVGKAEEGVPENFDSPADLAAYKSAQAMLETERKLREMIKAGKFKDIDKILTFEEISSWPYEEGLIGMPKAIKKLDGKKLMMTGFMLPIDEVEDIKEFLLVQSLWSCCYGQPPDINGIVRVVMKGKARIDYQFDPIKIVGDFKVEAAYEDGYCLDIYQLHADSVEAIL